MNYVYLMLILFFFRIYASEVTGTELVLFRSTLNTNHAIPAIRTDLNPENDEEKKVRIACTKTKIAVLTGLTSLIGTGVTIATVLLTQHTSGGSN